MQRGKRAASQIDWIMSLAIFVLYLAWFFAYVQPFTIPPEKLGSILTQLSGKLDSNITWTMEVVPIIMYSNISGTDEPVIADFPYHWNETSFSFTTNNTFFLDGDKLFFFLNMTEGKTVHRIAHSTENYSQRTGIQRDLIAASDFASIGSEKMRANFKDSVLTEVIFEEKSLIQKFNATINDVQLITENKTFTLSNSVAKYAIQAPLLNHSAYIFADNPRIYTIVKLNKNQETKQNFSIQAIMGNSTKYFSDTSRGEINYNNTCLDFLSNYMDFYDEARGITFIFSERANMSLCTENSTLKFVAYYALLNDTRYDIIAHQGAYNNTLKYRNPYKARFGMPELQTGVSYRQLTTLNATGYSTLKRSWNIPPIREFSFSIANSNNTDIFIYEPVPPKGLTNVFAKERRASLLDQYGNYQSIFIRVNGW